MTKISRRSLERMVEEQLGKWNLASRERKPPRSKPRPVITISREPGCGASEVAKRLAEDLGMDLMGGLIIEKVAESAQMSRKIVSSLDEREISKRDDWLSSLFETRHLWPDDYLFHLTKVIGTVGRHGNAVIVGRGAHLILPSGETFRVRFSAPLSCRIRHMMEAHGLPQPDAEKYLVRKDAERRAFIWRYFHADLTDPRHYDLLINMSKISVDGALEAVKAAFASWKR